MKSQGAELTPCPQSHSIPLSDMSALPPLVTPGDLTFLTSNLAFLSARATAEEELGAGSTSISVAMLLGGWRYDGKLSKREKLYEDPIDRDRVPE